MTKKFLDYLPLLTIVLIYFGYCNLYYYYKEFKIDIYNYISNAEILLSFLPVIVIITATLGTSLFQYIISRSSKEKQRAIDEGKRINESPPLEIHKKGSSKFWKSILTLQSASIILFIVNLVVIEILLNYYHYKRYELKEYFLYTSFIFPFFLYGVITSVGTPFIINRYSFIIAASLIFYIATSVIGTFRKQEAEELKEKGASFQVSFKYNNQIIKTSRTLLFIGQTQSAVFLYNKSDSSTITYSRSSVDSIVIK